MRIQSTSSGGLSVGELDSRYLRLAGGDLTGAVTLTKAAPSIYPADSTMPPAYSVAQEWANAGKTWTALQVSVTNTASGSASKLTDLQVGGSSVFSVRKDGRIDLIQPGTNIPSINFTSSNYGIFDATGGNGGLWIGDLGFSVMLGVNGAGAVLTNGKSFCWTAYPNSTSPDTGLSREAAGVVKVTDGAGSLGDWKARRGSLSEYLDINEMSAPAAPAANTARLYVEDNGSGKTRLCVRFPTGAVQVLATEP